MLPLYILPLTGQEGKRETNHDAHVVRNRTSLEWNRMALRVRGGASPSLFSFLRCPLPTWFVDSRMSVLRPRARSVHDA